MITKAIIFIVAASQEYGWNKILTGFLIAAAVCLGVLLLPLIALLACLYCMFIEQ